MSHVSPRIRSLLCALLVVGAFGGCPVARAQEGTVLLQCSAGFGDVTPRGQYSFHGHLGDWVPFRVTVLNVGPAASGTLAVTVKGYNGVATRYEKRITLPAGGRQAHEILARVVGANEAPIASFDVDGSRVAEVEVPLGTSPGDRLRLGVVDREETALNDISSVTVDPNDQRRPFTNDPSTTQQSGVLSTQPGGPAGAQPAGYPTYVQGQSVSIKPFVFPASDLPRHWLGYATLDALVLNDAPLSGVDEAQAAALRAWVANGGLLIATGGTDFAGLRRAGLDDLLPVEVTEKRTVQGVPGLEAAYGAFDTDAGALVAVGSLRDGSSTLLMANAINLQAQDRTPVVAERLYGAGRVRYLAVDPKLAPYRGWVGTARLWADLMLPAAIHGASGPQYISYGLYGDRMNLMYDLADVRAPLVGYFFLYLFVYVLLLGPVNYAVLRFKRRLEYAWITIPAAVVLFSLGTVATARLLRGSDSVVVTLSVDQYFQREGIGFSRSDVLLVPSAKDVYRIGLAEGAGCEPTGNFQKDSSEEFALGRYR